MEPNEDTNKFIEHMMTIDLLVMLGLVFLAVLVYLLSFAKNEWWAWVLFLLLAGGDALGISNYMANLDIMDNGHWWRIKLWKRR